jgi:hypothetical protein
MKLLKNIGKTRCRGRRLTGQAFAADVTIRLAHLNPEDPFQSHSGAMAAVFKSLVERPIPTAPSRSSCSRTASSARTTKSSTRSAPASWKARSPPPAALPSIIRWSAFSTFPSPSRTSASPPRDRQGQRLRQEIRRRPGSKDRAEGARDDRLRRLLRLHQLQGADHLGRGHGRAEDPHHDAADPRGDHLLARRPADPAALGGSLHRPADRRCRRPDEPGSDHRLRQVRRGPEVPLDHQPRDHALCLDDERRLLCTA